MWAFADRWGARMVGVLLTGRREACERGSGGATDWADRSVQTHTADRARGRVSGGFGVDQLWLAF